jgi:hypothetical protein
LESLGQSMPIGIASEVGRTDEGVAIWRLDVHGVEVPGRWIIVDREFRPAATTGGADRTGPTVIIPTRATDEV